MPDDRPLLVVSPHYDDAVLSMGQTLAANPGSIVATVCTAEPDDAGLLTDYDRETGFTTSVQSVRSRRIENVAALGVLGATPIDLGFTDIQYAPRDRAAVVDALAELFGARHESHRICIPLGLLHFDHIVIANQCMIAIVRAGATECWVYEEMPYNVRDDDFLADRLQHVADHGWALERDSLGAADVAVKTAALACYSSQMPLLSEFALDVPETIWHAVRSGS